MPSLRTVLAASIMVASAIAFGSVLENRKLWYDEEDTAMFVAALSKRGIPFRRDSDGAIWYPASEVRAIDEISAMVLKRCPPGQRYFDPRDTASFVERLRAAGIPFETCRRHGAEYYSWPRQFDVRVNEIMEIVENESSQRARAERMRAQDRK